MDNKGLADILVGCAQLLDTIKGEWGASWSEWDQSIRDGITSQLKILYAATPQVAAPAPRPAEEAVEFWRERYQSCSKDFASLRAEFESFRAATPQITPDKECLNCVAGTCDGKHYYGE